MEMAEQELTREAGALLSLQPGLPECPLDGADGRKGGIPPDGTGWPSRLGPSYAGM